MLGWYSQIKQRSGGRLCVEMIASLVAIAKICLAFSSLESNCPSEANTILTCGQKCSSTHCSKQILTISGVLLNSGTQSSAMAHHYT